MQMLLKVELFETKMSKEALRTNADFLINSLMGKVEVSGLSRVGLPHEMFDAVSLNTNGVALETSSLMRRKAALAAMSRGVGFDVRTGTTIATPRAGARTTSQTTYVLLYRAERAFGWVLVAHPSVLLDLLRCYSISLPRRVPRYRLTHHPWW